MLYRYTGQEDIVVGSPIAGRTRVETENLIGFFVNTLALRTDVSGNPTFQQLLARVRDVTLGAYAHQELPFDRLIEELHPERSLSHLPLTRLMFVVQHDLLQRMEWPGLNLEFEEPSSETAKFEATFVIQEIAEELYVKVEYNTDLFDEVTITQMIIHYQTLLEAVVSSPEQPVSDLVIMTDAERRQVEEEWNETRVDHIFSTNPETFSRLTRELASTFLDVGRCRYVPSRWADVRCG